MSAAPAPPSGLVSAGSARDISGPAARCRRGDKVEPAARRLRARSNRPRTSSIAGANHSLFVHRLPRPPGTSPKQCLVQRRASSHCPRRVLFPARAARRPVQRGSSPHGMRMRVAPTGRWKQGAPPNAQVASTAGCSGSRGAPEDLVSRSGPRRPAHGPAAPASAGGSAGQRRCARMKQFPGDADWYDRRASTGAMKGSGTANPHASPNHEPDADYFARRAREENRAAEQAGSSQAGDVHRLLANKYRALAARYAGPPQDDS